MFMTIFILLRNGIAYLASENLVKITHVYYDFVFTIKSLNLLKSDCEQIPKIEVS